MSLRIVAIVLLSMMALAEALTLPQLCKSKDFAYKIQDPEDCHSFYICLGNWGEYNSDCGLDYRFDEIQQKCVKGKCPPCPCLHNGFEKDIETSGYMPGIPVVLLQNESKHIQSTENNFQNLSTTFNLLSVVGYKATVIDKTTNQMANGIYFIFGNNSFETKVENSNNKKEVNSALKVVFGRAPNFDTFNVSLVNEVSTFSEILTPAETELTTQVSNIIKEKKEIANNPITVLVDTEATQSLGVTPGNSVFKPNIEMTTKFSTQSTRPQEITTETTPISLLTMEISALSTHTVSSSELLSESTTSPTIALDSAKETRKSTTLLQMENTTQILSESTIETTTLPPGKISEATLSAVSLTEMWQELTEQVSLTTINPIKIIKPILVTETVTSDSTETSAGFPIHLLIDHTTEKPKAVTPSQSTTIAYDNPITEMPTDATTETTKFEATETLTRSTPEILIDSTIQVPKEAKPSPLITIEIENQTNEVSTDLTTGTSIYAATEAIMESTTPGPRKSTPSAFTTEVPTETKIFIIMGTFTEYEMWTKSSTELLGDTSTQAPTTTKALSLETSTATVTIISKKSAKTTSQETQSPVEIVTTPEATEFCSIYMVTTEATTLAALQSTTELITQTVALTTKQSVDFQVPTNTISTLAAETTIKMIETATTTLPTTATLCTTESKTLTPTTTTYKAQTTTKENCKTESSTTTACLKQQQQISTTTTNNREIDYENTKANSICAQYNNIHFIKHRKECKKYFSCYKKRAYPQICPGHFYFDDQLKMCNYPDMVDCTIENEKTNIESDTKKSSLEDQAHQTSNKKMPISTHNLQPEDCEYLRSGLFIRDPKNCNKYYVCLNGYAVALYCPRGQYFDNENYVCNFKALVKNCMI